MLVVGTDEGAYRFDDRAATDSRRVLDAAGVMRLRRFEGLRGTFAATAEGLFHSLDCDAWTDLGVPRESVYAVAASPDGDRLYAGTRPAHVYVAGVADGLDDLSWRECEGFQDLPSRDDWRLPRHENLAQVRDLHVPDAAPNRVVAGAEVGGVHVSDDGGDTWTERRDGTHDDVHELRVLGPEEFVAGTGFGLFRTTDAGRSWTRLDDGVDQRYVRSVFVHDGDVYAGAALASSASWDEEDADPALLVSRDGDSVERVAHPRSDEVVTGMTAVDGRLVAGTHRGSVLVRETDGWTVAGSIPVDGSANYTPMVPTVPRA